MVIYKYRDCTKRTEDIIREQRVWLAKPRNLNDPCECSIHDLSPDWVQAKVTEMKQAHMAGAFAVPGSLPPVFLKAVQATLPSLPDFNEKYAAFRALYEKHLNIKLSDPDSTFSSLDEQLNSIGIFSGASCPEEPLMWSHYGQGHAGICLGFEVRDLTPSSDPDRFLKVRYSDDIPRFGGEGFTQELSISVNENGRPVGQTRIALSDATLRAAITTKATCWSYEQEWRYVEPKGDAAYPFPGPLVEIVFGFRCSPENRSYYTQLAATHLNNDVRLYEIRRMPNSFKFDRVFLGLSSSQKDVSAAHPHCPQAVDETSISDTYPQIQVMLEHGQYSRALPALEEATRKDPTSARLWRTKGVVLGQAHRDEEALHCFERAIELEPSFFSAWYHRGVALMHMGRLEDAVTAYTEARKLKPSDSSTLFNLGCVYEELGKNEAMKECYLAAERAGHPRAAEALRDAGNEDKPG